MVKRVLGAFAGLFGFMFCFLITAAKQIAEDSQAATPQAAIVAVDRAGVALMIAVAGTLMLLLVLAILRKARIAP